MADLLVISFPNEQAAEQLRAKLFGMQREYLIEMGDAVVAVKQPDGQVKLNQVVNPTMAGAASGTMWGTLVGLIFLMPLVGAALGAASGALAGKLTDVGINDKFMKEVAAELHAGNAALFLLIRKMTTDKVLAGIEGSGGTLMRSSFDETKEATIREALAHASAAAEAGAKPAAG